MSEPRSSADLPLLGIRESLLRDRGYAAVVHAAWLEVHPGGWVDLDEFLEQVFGVVRDPDLAGLPAGQDGR